MKSKKIFVWLFLLAIVCFSGFALAHEGEEEEPVTPTSYLPLDPFIIAQGVFALVLILAIFSIFFQNRLNENAKKTIFVVVAVPVILTTIYMAGSTVYLNIISESGGPVHWHADFEIWVCGEKISNLNTSEGLSNKIGTEVFHHHNDYRIHIEGIVIDSKDIALGEFFEAIGGEFHGDHLKAELESGQTINISNNDLCPDGKTGKWKLFAKNWQTNQFEEKAELEHYIVQPHFNVPPGDYLLLVFDSEGGVPVGS